jgi:hypothetical protein
VDNSWQQLGFFYRKPMQQKYSPLNRDLRAIFSAVKYFKHCSKLHTSLFFMENKPITFAFTKSTDTCSPRQFRYLDFVAQLTTDMRHTSGQSNIVADAMLRIAYEPAQEPGFSEESAILDLLSAVVQTPLDYATLAKAQEEKLEFKT